MHDLVLAGIGGKTVEEARRNLSYKEVCDWAKYVKENGSVSPVKIAERNIEHLEWISAKICWAMFKAMGAKSVNITDFIPKKEEAEEIEEAETLDIKDALNLLKSVRVKK